MFQRVAEGTPITLYVQYADDYGHELIGVVSTDWKLVNQLGKVVQSGTEMPVSGSKGFNVNVDGYLNVAEGGFLVSTYELDYVITLKLGEHRGSVVYQVEKKEAFSVGESTFLSYLESLSLIREIPDMGAFSTATKEERMAALMFAYEEIGGLELNNAALPKDLRLNADNKPIVSTKELTNDALMKLPNAMLKDFYVAQLIEANALLGGDEIAKLRDLGVQSYTVGEVKQFFQGRAPASFGLSIKALRRIGKYMRFARSTARA